MPMTTEDLLITSYNSLISMVTDEGINASSREEMYGCIFGRDTAITILKILRVCSRKLAQNTIDTANLLDISKRALRVLGKLQGNTFNIESGEEPGKFIHEYRTEKYDLLVKLPRPWYIYPDGIMRNYDSVDSTPLGLIAIYRYWQLTKDREFVSDMLPVVKKALDWLIKYADRNKDNLIDYEFAMNRKYGGLTIQSWTDSVESHRLKDGTLPIYPISPVEVQGYAWLALKLWSGFFRTDAGMEMMLSSVAKAIKERFNEHFIFKDGNHFFVAQALDGRGNQLKTVTGNPLLLLWASLAENGNIESILEEKYVRDVVKRCFMPDLFDEDAGIRTMSTLSPTYNPKINSYHNGSFWPKLNGMSHEGLEMWLFIEEAHKLKEATLKPLLYFGTPIELYIRNEKGEYMEFRNNSQVGCRQQAWTAATIMDLLAN